ncbi:VIT1/CCC1 transporter family protein [Candidatus Woesebacteria bacterium]|nr:VIT1/CCC1 transporter family protein [Candidatus Woesebacteria bacterium]
MPKSANSKLEPKFLKAAVYGANDGIITTFAVVAGVAGAQLSPTIIIILGIANMVADGLSMAVGDFLGERSEHRLRNHQDGTKIPEGLWKTGAITFVAFVTAGSMPLIPYLAQMAGIMVESGVQFPLSVSATGFSLFLVGSLRTIVTKGAWWKNGVEMLSIGAIAASVAYGLGALIERLV